MFGISVDDLLLKDLSRDLVLEIQAEDIQDQNKQLRLDLEALKNDVKIYKEALENIRKIIAKR